MRWPGLAWVPLALLSMACGNPTSEGPAAGPLFPQELLPDELLPELELLIPKPGGLAFFTPIIRDFQPGLDETYCTFTDTITDEALLVHQSFGRQSSFGHHALLYYTTAPKAPTTELCKSSDHLDFTQVIGGTGGNGDPAWDVPDRIATEIPAGVQFVLQSHWVNSSAKPVDVQAMMITEPAESTGDTILVGTFSVLSTNWEIPAHGALRDESTCEFKEDLEYVMAIGHEHEWGSHIKVEVLRAAGATDVVIDLPFEADFTFEPPIYDFPVDQPLTIRAGDKVRLTCDWENTTDDALSFPREMCVFFGYTIGQGDAVCYNGTWFEL